MEYHFFSSHGGVSPDPYSSLNVSRFVGDDPLCVDENRRRVKKRLDGIVMVSAHQVHEDKIFIVDKNPTADVEVDGYDALITNCPKVILMVQLADCQGVLLHDPEKSVIAAIHCGWKGNVVEIIGKTILAMKKCFNSSAEEIQAFISPSLGPCCAEFINYREELPQSFHPFQINPMYFNFWDISKSQLVASGLDEKNIMISEICTSCSKDYYSYRRACRNGNGVTGRHCGVISL